MNLVRSFATAVLVVATGSCAPRPPLSPSGGEREAADLQAALLDAARPAPSEPSPVVIVTIDGARWQDVLPSTALMPTLHELGREHGAFVGADARTTIRASGPNFVSLPGYTELFTGRPPAACKNNDCDRTKLPTLLDRAAAAGREVAAFASWERLDRALTSSPGMFLVSAGRGSDDDTNPWPGAGEYRPDRKTAWLALDYLERRKPDVLFIGLGDTDELAHQGNVEGYRRALAFADAVLAQLRVTLDRMGERGRATHIFVTADHGRAKDFRTHGDHAPESARVWLVAAGPRIKARGVSSSPRDRHLADVTPTIAALIGLDRTFAPGGGEVLGELFDKPKQRVEAVAVTE